MHLILLIKKFRMLSKNKIISLINSKIMINNKIKMN